ncbi:hypothetical protein BDV95DRAFT_622662 [Massariosphaeria phaeospora]|uniref:Uncharacterized protein n=1 Tax=Massariosphaeria phaeospora TaxID=100035 RepID=A0A7C8I074_9PLEO|nr:hypothetical protein BDV95DRAFT_622662 [Massariosphaeria phaeospora]
MSAKRSKPSPNSNGVPQAKTFETNDRKLRIVLKKDDWIRLALFCQVPKGLTAETAQQIRHRVTLAPERVDYRDRAMLQLPNGVCQGEMHFRHTGVLLPYSCSINDFTIPNPTLLQSNEWPMKDSASPRDGWLINDYMKFALPAKADAFGAIFFYVRGLLLKFCGQLLSSNVSFRIFNMDARDLGGFVDGMKFDRVEISNICDTSFLGPHVCLQVFSPLLKPKSQNPNATLLMLFLNAAVEADRFLNPHGDFQEVEIAIKRVNKYLPLDVSQLPFVRSEPNY